MATPEELKDETLLNIGQGASAPGSTPPQSDSQTLLNLEGAPENESVLARVARIAGAEIPQTIEEYPSDARTITGSGVKDNAGRESGRVGDTLNKLGTAARRWRYTTESEVGQGGMGIVLRTRDNDLRRAVAMKVIRRERFKPGSEDGVNALRRFIEEAQITGQLEHPNIVPVHELGADTYGRPYFTMKLVRGRPLSEVLRGLRACEEPMLREYPLERLLQVLIKVCDALSFAHAHGVIHRDLKPDNIMVGDYGEVVVMDWGLAYILGSPQDDTAKVETDNSARKQAGDYEPSSHSMEGSIAGTPSYMAPEQARGELSRIDRRTDVFALGALLYDLLVLRPPYHGQKSSQLLELAVRAEITPPAQRIAEDADLARAAARRLPRKRVPPELAAVALHAMRRDREHRYPDVTAFAADVQNYIAGRAVSVRRDPPMVRVAKWVRRHPTLAMTSSVAVIALLVGAATVMALIAQAERERTRQQRELAQQQSQLASKERALAAESAERERQAKLHADSESRRAEEESKRAQAEADLRDKERALLEAEKARRLDLERRARAEQSYRLGKLHAERARETSNDALQANARREAERLLEQAINDDPGYADPVFTLAQLHAFFGDGRAMARFVQADAIARKAGGKGDARALVYAGDFVRQWADDVETAREYYENAAKVAPDDPLALVGQGYVALLEDEFSDALKFARAAREKDPALWEPLLLEGMVCATYSGSDEDEARHNPHYDAAHADELFTRALERNNREGSIYAERGRLRVELGHLDEAEEDLLRAGDLLPDNEEAGAALAACLRLQYRFDEAWRVIDQLTMDPGDVDSPETWNEHGSLLLHQRKTDKALASFRRALELDPGRPNTLARMAAAYLAMGRPELARASLRMAHREPDNAEVLHASAMLNLRALDAIAAMRDVERGLAGRPHDRTLGCMKARLLALLSKPDEAAAQAQRMIAAHPDFDGGYLAMGLAQIAARAPETACVSLRKALALNSHSAEAALLLGNCLASTGKHGEALAHLQTAVDLAPEDPVAWRDLGRCHAELKNWREGIESLREAAALGDNSADTCTRLAQCATELGLKEEALHHAEKATKVEPRNVLAWVRLSEALFHAGKRTDAQVCVAKAEALPWTRPEDRLEVGSAMLALGRAEDALKLAREVVEAHPAMIKGWMLVGASEERLNRPEEAIRAYSRVYELDTESATACEFLAELYYKLNLQEDAIYFAKAGLKRAPGNFRCHLMLGSARLSLGIHDVAIENFEAALRINPEDALTLLRMGAACTGARRYREGIDYLQQCLKWAPSASEAHYFIGLCRRELGEFDDAANALRRAIELDEKYTDAMIVLAELLNDRGDNATAENEAERAIKVDASRPGPWFQLGRARFALARFADALEAFKRAQQLLPVGLVHTGVARCHLELRQYEEAIVAGELAASAENSPSADGLVVVAAAQLHMDKTAEALATLRKAIVAGADRAWAYGFSHFAVLKDNDEFKRLQRDFPAR